VIFILLTLLQDRDNRKMRAPSYCLVRGPIPFKIATTTLLLESSGKRKRQ